MSSLVAVSAVANEKAIAMENEERHLTEDIQIEILQHLSLRALAKANSISKLWRNFISTNSLLLRSCRPFLWPSPLQQSFFFHSSNIPKNGVQIHSFSTSNPPKIPLHQFPSPNFPFRLLAASNGLLLAGRSDHSPIVHYFVWNPAANAVVFLPRPPSLSAAVKIGFHSEPNCRSADSECFTVVRLGVLEIVSLEIYSSETGVWRRVDLNLAADSLFLPAEGPAAAVLDGVFYWVEFGSLIYAFDLLNFKFLEVGFPPESSDFRRNVFSRCLSAAGGAIQMASTDGDWIEIWALRSNRSSWALRRRLSVGALVGNNANIFGAPAAIGRRFVGIVGFQPRDSGKLFLNTTEMVGCCDIGSEKVEMVHRFDGRVSCRDVCELMFFPYEFYGMHRLI